MFDHALIDLAFQDLEGDAMEPSYLDRGTVTIAIDDMARILAEHQRNESRISALIEANAQLAEDIKEQQRINDKLMVELYALRMNGRASYLINGLPADQPTISPGTFPALFRQ